MIEVKYRGAMGEHLIQYLVARFFAERWNFSLKAGPISGIPGSYTPVKGVEYYSPLLRISGVGLKCIEYGCDISSQWLSAVPVAHIQMQGFCQSPAILREAMAEARKWLLPASLPERPSPGTFTLGCHYGRSLHHRHLPGHLGSHQQVPTYDFPTAADILNRLEGRSCNLLLICTDRPHSPVWEELGRHIQTRIVSEGSLNNYRHLVGARNLMFAGSAFDWVSSITSNAELVLPSHPGHNLFSAGISPTHD